MVVDVSLIGINWFYFIRVTASALSGKPEPFIYIFKGDDLEKNTLGHVSTYEFSEVKIPAWKCDEEETDFPLTIYYGIYNK